MSLRESESIYHYFVCSIALPRGLLLPLAMSFTRDVNVCWFEGGFSVYCSRISTFMPLHPDEQIYHVEGYVNLGWSKEVGIQSKKTATLSIFASSGSMFTNSLSQMRHLVAGVGQIR